MGSVLLVPPASDALREEVLQQLEQIIGQGVTKSAACAVVGISRDTMYEWVKRFPDAHDRLTRAELKSRSKVEGKFFVDATDGEDWRAREAWLKRRYPDTWGDKLDLRRVDDDTLRRLYAVTQEDTDALDAEYQTLPPAPDTPK